MFKRLVLLIVGLLLTMPTQAQQSAAKLPKVGILVTHAPLTDPVMTSIRSGLRSVGYEEGKTIQLEFVTAEGQLDRLPALAQELIQHNVDVILSPNEYSAQVAKKATSTVPIVMVAWGGDPVQSGLISSLNRPGGNVTGIYSLLADVQAKQLEMLKEALPRLTRVAVLRDPVLQPKYDHILAAAKTLKLKTDILEVRGAEDLALAFKTAKEKRAGAVLLLSSPIFYVYRDTIAKLAFTHRLPVVAGGSQQVEAGFLMSYGNDYDELYRRTAYYVDRILKGTPPQALPVEQVMRLTLAINFKTAKALGVKFPESILVRADKVVR